MADSPVQVTENTEKDERHTFQEVHAVTDRVITDPEHELAVQIPEDSGASTYGQLSPTGEAFKLGTPQEQFDRDQAEADKAAKDAAKKS